MVAMVLAVATSSVFAGEHPVLQAGSRVRITLIEPKYGSILEPKRIKGTLISITESAITMETSADKPPTVFPQSNVEMLELNTQRGRRSRGTLIGLVAGAATGVLVALVAEATHEDDPDTWEFFDTRTGMIFTAFWLGSAGALIGALVAPGERWYPIPADQMQVGIGQGQHGEGLVCFTVRF